MTGFNHVLVGLTIAVVTREPILAPVAALLSHFVLDALPHFGDDRIILWEREFMRLIVLDAVLCFLALGLGLLLFPQLWWLLMLCAFAATLPDWLWPLHLRYNLQHPFFDIHAKIQWGERPWGLWVEIPFACVLVALLVGMSGQIK